MTTVAVTHLRSALEAINIAGHPLDLDMDQLRHDVSMALAAIQQQPGVLNAAEVSGLVNNAIRSKFDGNMTAAARAWGLPKQSVHAFLNGDRCCPPAVLDALGLRKRTAGRDLYEQV